MKNSIKYQYCYSRRNCQSLNVSAIKEKPSIEEIATRDLDDYETDALTWAYELLEMNSDTGKMSFDNDYVYRESTLEEIRKNISDYLKSSDSRDIQIGEALERQLAEIEYISTAAALLGAKGGKIGGKAKTEAKKASSKENGKLGGRPAKNVWVITKNSYGAAFMSDDDCLSDHRNDLGLATFYKSEKSAEKFMEKKNLSFENYAIEKFVYVPEEKREKYMEIITSETEREGSELWNLGTESIFENLKNEGYIEAQFAEEVEKVLNKK